MKTRLARRAAQSLFVLATLTLSMLVAPRNAMAQDEASNKLRVGVTRYVGDAHNYVADEIGLFSKHGLNVTLAVSKTGLESVRRMLRGELDLARVTATPLVFAAQDPNFLLDKPAPEHVVVANLMQSTSFNTVVVRRNGAIKTPRDLEGRSIALTKGTGSEYYWYTYALYHDIDAGKVRIVGSGVLGMAADFASARPMPSRSGSRWPATSWRRPVFRPCRCPNNGSTRTAA